MTNKEKARAYDEALEKAKKKYNSKYHPSEGPSGVYLNNADLEEIFPALKESEDERILNGLIASMKDQISCGGESYFGMPLKDILAYLEKQKENVEKEYVFRPMAGTDITIAVEQAIRMAKEGHHLVLAFNGMYRPVSKYDSAKSLVEEYDYYLEKQKDASKAIEAVERIDKYIDEHTTNAHDMDDSNPDKEYYSGWDDALGKMAGILQDVYSEGKQKECVADSSKTSADEDNRIRQFFAELATNACGGPGQEYYEELGLNYEKAMSWLEKQKEQKPTINIEHLKSYMLQYLQDAANRKDDSEIEADTDKWAKKIIELIGIEPSADGKEILYVSNKSYDIGFRDGAASVKPAEWSEEDKVNLKRAINICVNDFGEESKTAQFLKSLPERFNLQPKQEWSEEDEKKMIFLERLIEHNVPDGQYGWADGRNGGFVTKLEAISMLKSLRPQPKVEWSEEDKKMIERLITRLNRITYNTRTNGTSLNVTFFDEIAWFKSLRLQPKCRDTYYDIIHNILATLKDMDFTQITPQHRISLLNDIRVKCKNADELAQILDEPHWKPSKQQMQTLLDVINGVIPDPDGAMTEEEVKELDSLHNDLKKL